MALDSLTPEQIALIEPILKVRLEDMKREINRLFMCYGPGKEWDAWKERNAVTYQRINILSDALGMERWG